MDPGHGSALLLGRAQWGLGLLFSEVQPKADRRQLRTTIKPVYTHYDALAQQDSTQQDSIEADLKTPDLQTQTIRERFLPIDFGLHGIRIGPMKCLLDNTLITDLVLIDVLLIVHN